MAAIIKRLFRVRPNSHSYGRPHSYPLHHFSSSTDPDALSDIPQPEPNPADRNRSSLSSGYDDVLATLNRQSPPQNRSQIIRTPPPSTAGSTDRIRRQLSEFRVRASASSPSSTGNVSLTELYVRNVDSKGEDSTTSQDFNLGVKRPFDSIRSSLHQHNKGARNDSAKKVSNQWSLSRFTEKLKADANANHGSAVFTEGNESLFPSHLGKETRGKGDSNLASMKSYKMLFGVTDDPRNLGKKLKKLRPENRKGKWFSLQELSDRLAKLKEAEEKESEARPPSAYDGLRDGILKAKQSKKEEEGQKSPMLTLGYLGIMGGTQSYDMSPPKDDLVEKYFHPDNMSASEKLKLELKKVRDEFKMSESDCGSARVQVAQLTTKISYLTTVLPKKDKHSRRGLQAMVERRKKLLTYLRRTDWDSYCLVLSKLGLRDFANKA